MFRFGLICGIAIIACGQTVQTRGGAVSGIAGKDASIRVYKGIPFAAPPVGDLRWRAPRTAAAWQGVRKADQFSASCIQNIVEQQLPWTYEFMTHTAVSEDCLYLNVWTPAKSGTERRPVFVYIYGGAFTSGSGAVPLYDGEGLAKKGVVMVTFNYRVGLMGFFAHPELTKESDRNASGNYGLLDQVAALEWIRDNIAAFGGDPNRVTIAGQSAGGMSVHDLIASPLAKGLFQRAIVDSGGSSIGGGAMRPRGDAEADGVRFAQAKGAASLADLRAMTWQKLTEPLPAGAGRGMRYGPIVDGYLLPAPVHETVQKGKQNDVPTLTGVNLGELGGLAGPGAAIKADAFREQVRRRYGDMADEFLKLYPAGSDAEALASQQQSSRDSALVSLYLWAADRAKTAKTPAYLYLWDHPLPGPDAPKYGAFHSSELPYVLNTLAMSDRPFAEQDRKIADALSSYWANFTKAGDPNGKGLPKWTPAGSRPEVMEIGDRMATIPAADPAKVAFFEKFLTR